MNIARRILTAFMILAAASRSARSGGECSKDYVDQSCGGKALACVNGLQQVWAVCDDLLSKYGNTTEGYNSVKPDESGLVILTNTSKNAKDVQAVVTYAQSRFAPIKDNIVPADEKESNVLKNLSTGLDGLASDAQHTVSMADALANKWQQQLEVPPAGPGTPDDKGSGKAAGGNPPPSPDQVHDAEKKADALFPNNPQISGDLGRQYLAAGSPGDADRLLTRSLDAAPGNPSFEAARAAARVETGNLRGALADAQDALRAQPENKMARAAFEYASQALRKDAPAQLEKPNFGAMAAASGPSGGRAPGAFLGSTLEGANPTFTGGGVRSLTPSQALAADAESKLKLGDLRGALLLASQALAADPKNAAAYALRASILNKMGRFQAAKEDAARALALDPRSTRALNERSYAENKLAEYPPALKDAETSLGIDPRQAMAHLNRAMALEGLGRFEEALKEYKLASQFDPALEAFYEDAVAKYGEQVGWKDKPGRKGAGRLGGLAALKGPAPLAALAALAAAGLFGLLRLRGGSREAAPVGPQFETPTAAAALRPSDLATASATLPSDLATAAAVAGNGAGLLGGSYKLVKEIGRGGMGVVHEGLDVHLGRKVAVKEMRAEMRQSAKDLERFLAEARLVAGLKHPNIAEIYAVVQESGGVYLIFELVSGKTLDKVLDQRPRLSLAETRRILADVCRALEYAHSKKVIHRDLKPSNVMVTEDGSSKVMDFGIAHQAKLTVSKLTSAEAWGTPAYMPPEQEMGSVSRESDLYALAAMAYEMTTGTVPFPGPNFLAQKQARMYRAPSELVAGLPKALDAFFDVALHPDPAQRFHGAPEFLKAFELAAG